MKDSSSGNCVESPLPYRFSVVAIAVCLAIIIIYAFPSIATFYSGVDVQIDGYYDIANNISIFFIIGLIQYYPPFIRRIIKLQIRIYVYMIPGFGIDDAVRPLEPQPDAVSGGSGRRGVDVTLIFPRLLGLGGGKVEYEIGLDNALLARTTYSRGITINFTVDPGHHELEIRTVGYRVYQAFDLDFPESGHFRVDVVMGWGSYWRRPKITWQA